VESVSLQKCSTLETCIDPLVTSPMHQQVKKSKLDDSMQKVVRPVCQTSLSSFHRMKLSRVRSAHKGNQDKL
jgi:hypothetical protein